MRTLLLAALPLMLLAACSGEDEQRNAAAAVAAGFEPPTVRARTDFGMDIDKRFDRLDLNGDSVLERNEWPPRYAERMAELDQDKDGKITNGEFFEALMARFDAADTNHDQVLTSDENAAADIPDREDDNDGKAEDAGREIE